MAITGVHAVLYTRDPEADRAWLADVLGLESVDAGGGWLIFALPPAELAAHPVTSEGGDVELYLMCENIETTVRGLRQKQAAFDGEVTDERWGRLTKLGLPSGACLGLYEPRHASPLLPAEMDKAFIVNVADAPATARPGQAIAIDFESEDAPWRDTGINIMVMLPGQPNCLYHREPVQEDFLVLHGECVAVVNGEERRMRQWDLAVGGGVRSTFWPQVVSDVTGVRQVLPAQTIGAAHGDALLAAIGGGLAPPETDWTLETGATEPRAEPVGGYAERYGMYRELYANRRRGASPGRELADRSGVIGSARRAQHREEERRNKESERPVATAPVDLDRAVAGSTRPSGRVRRSALRSGGRDGFRT